MNNTKKAIQMAQLPYATETSRSKVDDNSYVYIARNPELEGCYAQGDTPEQAQENLKGVRISHIEHRLNHRLPVATPTITSDGLLFIGGE